MTIEENHNSDKQTARIELSTLFETFSVLLKTFRQKDTLKSEDLAEAIQQSFKLLDTDAFFHFVALNNLNNNHTRLTNFVVKTVLMVNTISSQFHYDRQSQIYIAKSTLLLSLIWTKQLNNTSVKPTQIPLSQIAKQAFSLGKTATKNNAEVLRLLSQIGSFNEYQAKSQLSQSIILTTVNGCLLAMGLLTGNKSTPFNGLNRLPYTHLNKLSKPFVRRHCFEILERISGLSNIGLLVRTHVDQIGFLIACYRPLSQKIGKSTHLKQSTKWTVVTFEQSPFLKNIDIEIYKPNEIRFTAKLAAFDFTALDLARPKLCQFEAITRINKQLLAHKKDKCFLFPPDNLRELSRLILTSTTKKIAEHLQQDLQTASYIKQYASDITRVQKPINDIKHAAALIGIVRLYPVVCMSEIYHIQDEQRFIGSKEAYNKANQLAQIGKKLANDFGAEIPEYFGLINQLMMHALLMIPKGRYAASIGLSKLQQKPEATFAEFFAINHPKQWRQLVNKVTRQWLLPKAYQAPINDYFKFLEGDLDPNTLPRASKISVSVICLSQWVFVNMQLGKSQPCSLGKLKSVQKMIGYNDAELKQLYVEVIDSLGPQSKLF